ncbi:MAG TPA: hypothetical protein VF456_18855 [Vicinamibacterales bacterium]
MLTFSYRRAPVSLKLAVTAFLLLAVVGLGVAGLQIFVRAGLTPETTLSHFRGNEETMQYPLSFGAMVEITHAHAFAQPMLAFVLALVLLASSAFEWLKRLAVVSLFVGMAMEMGVPWLVRYGPAWTVHLLLLTGALIIVGVFVSVAIPLYEMWWPSGAADTTTVHAQEWRRAG